MLWVAEFGSVVAKCDMDTAGGGWTVLWETDGVNGRVPFTSDADATSDQYNLPRAVKYALTEGFAQTLARRSVTSWLVTDHAPVDHALLQSDPVTTLWPTEITAPAADGTLTSAPGWIGYSTGPIDGGGDFTISLEAVTSGSVNANASLVNTACSGQLLYSLSTNEHDGDGAYASADVLGNWTYGSSCSGLEDGMPVSIAVRSTASE